MKEKVEEIAACTNKAIFDKNESVMLTAIIANCQLSIFLVDALADYDDITIVRLLKFTFFVIHLILCDRWEGSIILKGPFYQQCDLLASDLVQYRVD